MLTTTDAQLRQHNASQLQQLKQLRRLGYDVNALCNAPELLVNISTTAQALIHILYHNMSDDVIAPTDRNYGLELMAVFHTMAINTLVAECIRRLGPNGAMLAKSLYMTWSKTVDFSYQQHLDNLKTRLTAEAYEIAEKDMLQTKSKAQQDVLSVLNLKPEDVQPASDS